MANGPLGGNMGTPPVPPQPPQVSFETTAQSRGNFNNFLKSMPNTTAMTPIPPLGSAPMMPAPNPMSNIDIFNQPPSIGMGMMGMNQPQMQQPMQQPMMQSPMMGGLMGTPVQNFFFGGEAMDFEGFSDSSDPFGGGDSFNDSNDTSDPVVGDTFDRSTSDAFQSALDDITLGSDDSMFADDPAIVDRRGVNVGLENTGGFTTGVVPNLRGERFTRFETPDYALRALGRDFQTKINRNPDLTVGDYFETFTPSSENPGGTGNRVAEFTRATGKGAGDPLSLNDMGNIMDIQYKFETGQGNTPAGRIEKIATTVPLDNENQIANILSGLDLNNALALDNKTPIVTANTLPPPSDYEENVGVPGALRQGDRIVAPGSGINFQYTTKGTTPKEQRELRELRDIDDAEFNPTVLEATDRGGRFGRALANDFLSARRMPGTAVGDIIQSIPQVDSFGDPARTDPRTMTESAIKTGTGQIAGMDENTFRSLSDEAQQRILSNIATADMGTTFTPYDPEPNFGIAPDTALETMAGRRDIFQPDDITFDPITIEEDDLTTVSPDLLSSIGREQRIDDANTFRSTVPDAARIFGGRQVSNLPIGSPARGGTASGEELDQAPVLGRSPGSLQAQYGDRLGPMLAGLNQTRQDALGDLSQQRDFNIPGTFGGILNALGNKSRSRMIDALSSGQGSRLFGGTYEPTPIYQDGRIVGVRDQYGNLMEGRDPFAPDTGSNENEDPLILRPIAKAKEEEVEEKDDTPPNIIGGGDAPAPTAPKSVVVDSPFTSNVSNFVPSTFNTGDINKLIAMLTDVPAPKSMKQGGVAQFQNGGRVDQALDRFLATA